MAYDFIDMLITPEAHIQLSVLLYSLYLYHQLALIRFLTKKSQAKASSYSTQIFRTAFELILFGKLGRHEIVSYQQMSRKTIRFVYIDDNLCLIYHILFPKMRCQARHKFRTLFSK